MNSEYDYMKKGHGYSMVPANSYVKGIFSENPAHNPLFLVKYGGKSDLVPIPLVNFTPGENPSLLTLDESSLKETSRRLAAHICADQKTVEQDLVSIIKSLRRIE